VTHAIIVSVDGLGGIYLEQGLTEGRLPNFAALKEWGASTTEARADVTYTVTLPNHTSIISGRPVSPVEGLAADINHGYYDNVIPGPEQTLHNSGNPNLEYLPSVFDTAHDHGLRTCFYAGKTKFILFTRSYDSQNGALDQFGTDDGRNKIDRCVIVEASTAHLIATAAADMAAGSCDLVFLHIPDLDALGHQSGWGSEVWRSGLDRVDAWIGQLISVAESDRSSPWGMVITADHGGHDTAHSDPTIYEDYRIPFFALSPTVPPGSDLYAITSGRRAHPGTQRPDYLEPVQPVRNLDAADAALGMLGLEPIAGSFAVGLLRPTDD
jgi:predicted AlkP superfamily pyrophosphatase or phosphodiesterase